MPAHLGFHPHHLPICISTTVLFGSAGTKLWLDYIEMVDPNGEWYLSEVLQEAGFDGLSQPGANTPTPSVMDMPAVARNAGMPSV